MNSQVISRRLFDHGYETSICERDEFDRKTDHSAEVAVQLFKYSPAGRIQVLAPFIGEPGSIE